MARRSRTRSMVKVAKLELAPLIDVVFILLIFFAVSTTVVVNQQGIQLILPAAETVASSKKGIVISVDKQQRLYWDGKRVSESDIRGRVAKAKSGNAEIQVIINADQQTPYSMVVRLLDEVRKAGCFDIVLEAQRKNG
ncbi:biopolymer transporter ExbD [bacterium]|jgi:biopolymer transport protein ExbD|nr:biopolymer transporter ExbD [bacterium]